MKLKIGAKIGGGFGVLITLIVVMATVSFFDLRNASEELQKVNAASLRMQISDDIVIQYKAAILGIRTYVAFGDEASKKQVEENLNKVVKLETDLLEVARSERKPEVQAIIDETKRYQQIVLNEYMPLAVAYNGELAEGRFAKAQEYKTQLGEVAKRVLPLAQSVERSVDGLSDINAKLVAELLKESSNNAARVITVSLTISGFVILFGIVVAIFLTRMVRKPIILLTEASKSYAKGDLRTNILYVSADELGDLAESLRTMRNNFVEMIRNIRISSEQLAAASEEMAASTEEVTSTSEEVARNMQSLAKEAESGNHSMLEASKALVHLSSLIQIAQSKANTTAVNFHTCLARTQIPDIKTLKFLDGITVSMHGCLICINNLTIS
jgi:methyl-accepting chemotaxis protein